MRNAVIRKRAIALRAFRDFPVRVVLGSTIEPDWATLSQQRVWAVPEYPALFQPLAR